MIFDKKLLTNHELCSILIVVSDKCSVFFGYDTRLKLNIGECDEAICVYGRLRIAEQVAQPVCLELEI